MDSEHPLMQIKSDKCKIVPTDLRGPSLKQHLILPELCRRFNPDVYHHPHFDMPLWQTVPSVLTVHDVKYIRHPDYFPERSLIKKIYMKRILAISLQRSKHVIAVSENTKKDLLDLFNIPEAKITVIHHGLSENIALNGPSVGDSVVLKKFGVRGRFILFVGERRPHKNIVNLIRAFKILLSEFGSDFQLVIVGKPYAEYRGSENEVSTEGISDHVLFTDYLNDHDLRLFYRNAEMLVLPSFYEGFGFPIIEAMELGIPVAGANCTSIPEIIGEAGLLFNPNDIQEMALMMKRLLKDQKLKERFVRIGKERVKKFTWDKTARETYRCYSEVYSLTLN